MNGNIAGIDARLSPDLRNEDIAQFLARCRRLDRVALRHTVGLDDRIEGAGGVADKHETTDCPLFQAQAQRRSRRGRGTPDPDWK